jgi:hypothetical protein
MSHYTAINYLSPLKRRSTIILHGSTSQEDNSEHHTRHRENLKSHILVTDFVKYSLSKYLLNINCHS